MYCYTIICSTICKNCSDKILDSFIQENQQGVFDNTLLQTHNLKKTIPKIFNIAKIIRYSTSWENLTCIPPSLHWRHVFKTTCDFHTLSSVVLLPDRISTWRDTVSTILFLLDSLSSSSTKRNYLTFCITHLKRDQSNFDPSDTDLFPDLDIGLFNSRSSMVSFELWKMITYSP